MQKLSDEDIKFYVDGIKDYTVERLNGLVSELRTEYIELHQRLILNEKLSVCNIADFTTQTTSKYKMVTDALSKTINGEFPLTSDGVELALRTSGFANPLGQLLALGALFGMSNSLLEPLSPENRGVYLAMMEKRE